MAPAKSSHDDALTDRPVVIVPLTDFGAAMADELVRALQGASARSPPWLACTALGADPQATLPESLTDVLHIGHVMDGACGAPCCSERIFAPRLFLLGAAAEMTPDLSGLRDTISAARRELDRSGLSGRVYATIYTGLLAGKFPQPEVLAALAEMKGVDAIFLISDSASSGYRLRSGDVPAVAALQMLIVARHPEVESRLTSLAGGGNVRQLSLGATRIHLSPDGLAAAAERELRREFSVYLTETDASSLANAAQTLHMEVEARGSRQRTALLKRQAQATRREIASLLKPAPRASWWSRLISLVWRRRSAATPVGLIEKSSLAPVQQDLSQLERRQLEVARLLLAAAAPPKIEDQGTPWEVRFSEHPAVLAHLRSLLPPVERLAGQLSARFDELSRDPFRLPQILDDLCRAALRGIDLRPVLLQASASEFLGRAASAAAPLTPWGGIQIERWCLLPSDLPPAWKEAALAHACDVLATSQSDVIVLNIAPQPSFSSLAKEVRHDAL